MRVVVDAQLPPALARWLEERGHTAEHLLDRAMASAADRAVWDYAAPVGAVVITKDEDFALRRGLTAAGPQVVWIRLGNTTRRALSTWFEPLFPTVLEALDRGEPLIEIA